MDDASSKVDLKKSLNFAVFWYDTLVLLQGFRIFLFFDNVTGANET